ncbi:MAG: adenosylcobinamide-GDP ribazoletransferase, partial [Sphingobacteriia bacterium]|nr:adenosylcobinamide-GDP ribazoletransferase [Sphingobacteriia bacterium]
MASAERGGLDLGALWLAGRFLTRLPFPEPRDIRPKQLGQAVCWYPLIGLLLGVLITLGAQGLRWLDPAVGAAIILILWVWSTGALHLDGLADSADAWVGGLAGRERTLEILKDPHSGPVGVTALLLVLIAKWAGLHALIDDGAVGLLMMVPLLGR